MPKDDKETRELLEEMLKENGALKKQMGETVDSLRRLERTAREKMKVIEDMLEKLRRKLPPERGH